MTATAGIAACIAEAPLAQSSKDHCAPHIPDYTCQEHLVATRAQQPTWLLVCARTARCTAKLLRQAPRCINHWTQVHACSVLPLADSPNAKVRAAQQQHKVAKQDEY
jgi:hypothetical protein